MSGQELQELIRHVADQLQAAIEIECKQPSHRGGTIASMASARAALLVLACDCDVRPATPHPSGEEELLTTAEVGQILRKPVGTLRQWRHRSFGPKAFRLGGTLVYPRSAVDAWIHECQSASEAGDQ